MKAAMKENTSSRVGSTTGEERGGGYQERVGCDRGDAGGMDRRKRKKTKRMIDAGGEESKEGINNL